MIKFAPRRLAHVNLWVSNLEPSMAFYEDVCGIELVHIEAAIRAGFHTNGNTNHDVGLIETSRGVDRLGRDGQVQIPATRGTRAGLNHLAWEMESQAALVAASRRAAAHGVAVRGLDHGITRSVYLLDPDGNGHEFYADSIDDWRRIFNRETDEVVTAQWDPLGGDEDPTPRYPQAPAIRMVERAPLHPVALTGAILVTGNFDRMTRFLVDVAGLAELRTETIDGRRQKVFGGTLMQPGMRLIAAADGEETGLRSVAFNTQPAVHGLREALPDLERRGLAAAYEQDGEGTQRLFVRDPDGVVVQFYRASDGAVQAPVRSRHAAVDRPGAEQRRQYG
ncbi:MAG: VOC family protein [Lautropia sp.]